MENQNAIFLSPTGVAAKALDGQTIHSYFGWPVTDNPVNLGIFSELSQQRLKTKLTGINTIVVDEMSRLTAHELHTIDTSLRALSKNKGVAFGGLIIGGRRSFHLRLGIND